MDSQKEKKRFGFPFFGKCALEKGERVLAGVSGTSRGSASPERSAKARAVHANNAEGAESSRMGWVLLGASCLLLLAGDPLML